jgi:beta-lactamase class A
MNKKILACFILIIIFLFLGISKLMKTELVVSFVKNKPLGLKEAVENSLKGANGDYGVVVKNLKTGQLYTKNETKTFEAGSLYKLWVLLTAFKQIEAGQIKEDDQLSDDIATLNNKFNIDPENAELKDGSINLTVKDAMNQMITISHNYAALLLADKVKISSVSRFLEENNFSNSKVGEPPKTTAGDIASLFEKIYKNELTKQENTQKILDFLKRQQLNDGLPKYLPNGTQVAHKTGDIGWFKHDGGIVFSEKGDYIIVIMSESDSPTGAQERIAEVSKVVYEYFTK